MLPSSRKVRRAEEALATIDQRHAIARARSQRSQHPYDLGREKGLVEAAQLVRRALRP